MPDVFKIADILVAHAARAYRDEIALIVYCGSYAKGRASPTSDLDLYYIPDDGKASSLSSQFVIDGLPYDLWPLSWKMAEEISDARSSRPWAVSASLIADTRVLFYRSEADLKRFNGLKANITRLTQPESRPAMIGRALEEFKNTLFQLGQMRQAVEEGDTPGFRWAGWGLVGSAVNCLALVNQTYFSKGWGANLPEILAMAEKPAGLEGMMQDILLPKDTAATLASAESLANSVRAILRDAQLSVARIEPASQVFKDFYYYVFEYTNKTLAACRRGDQITAASAAFLMQELICQLMNKVYNGFFPAAFNLLGEYTGGFEKAGLPDLLSPAASADLPELARRVRRLDRTIRDWLGEQSVDLGIMENEADLHRFLEAREAAAGREQ